MSWHSSSWSLIYNRLFVLFDFLFNFRFFILFNCLRPSCRCFIRNSCWCFWCSLPSWSFCTSCLSGFSFSIFNFNFSLLRFSCLLNLFFLCGFWFFWRNLLHWRFLRAWLNWRFLDFLFRFFFRIHFHLNIILSILLNLFYCNIVFRQIFTLWSSITNAWINLDVLFWFRWRAFYYLNISNWFCWSLSNGWFCRWFLCRFLRSLLWRHFSNTWFLNLLFFFMLNTNWACRHILLIWRLNWRNLMKSYLHLVMSKISLLVFAQIWDRALILKLLLSLVFIFRLAWIFWC